MGNLREFRSAKKRANCIVVSKCPDNLSENTKSEFCSKIGIEKSNIFFSSINYSKLQAFSKIIENEWDNLKIENILLVTGIANPKPLEEYLEMNYNVSVLKFKDHHNFNAQDIDTIHKKFDIFAKDKKAIVCTEKDYVRFSSSELQIKINNYPWYYQPITIQIDREEEFLKQIKEYVRTI